MRIFAQNFATDIFCAGAKFNVTLSIMTSNSDVFLSLSLLCSMMSSCVCLVSVISVLLSVSLYCYVYVEKELGCVRDIQLWLVDNLCHKYWDSHHVMAGPVSGVWAQTITSGVWAHLGPCTQYQGHRPAPGQAWLSKNQFLSVVVFSQHRRARSRQTVSVSQSGNSGN